MYTSDDMQCCGLREIDGLKDDRTPAMAMEEFAKEHYLIRNTWDNRLRDHKNFRFVIFSQAGASSTYGDAFAAYIREKELGEVVETGRHTNPNSGNILKAFIWTVDHVRVKSWWRAVKAGKNPPKRRRRKPVILSLEPNVDQIGPSLVPEVDRV